MYIPFYTKSVYSLLKSTLKIEDYVLQAKAYQLTSLALTDENNVYGLLKFYKMCKAHDIKPILGLTLTIQDNTPLILIAKNNEGYKNLLNLSTEYQIQQQIKSEFLSKSSQGLICIIPTLNNQFSHLLLNHHHDEFNKYLDLLKTIFNDDLYISVVNETNESSRLLNQMVINITKEHQISPVGLNEIRYLKEEDATTLRYLEAIDKGLKITNSIELFDNNHYFLSPESFKQVFEKYPEAIENTNKIAEMCQVKIDFDRLHLPKYQTPQNISSSDYLKALCKKGLEKRLNSIKIPEIYFERLKYELTIIDEMNYSDYFLIVFDFVRYAKQNVIYVGPGRGSAAGSLVSYVLGITNVDPIKYQLLFERFLNPERITMPDIDLDFQDDRRDEVIRYVQEKYGKHHVAHIIAFGTFAARSSIREVGKVMGIDDNRMNEILSFIDSKLKIEQNIKQNEELQNIIKEYKEINRLFQIAKKIESIPRNTTTHAAGIIICEEDLRNLSGLQPSLDDVYQTQYEAKDLESLNLLKMDFLGIRNLTAISQVIKLIKETHHINIDINSIPLDDKKTYRLIARGETTGIFQLESRGMRNVLQEIKTSEFEDIVAVNALYRPGPMDNISVYIARKNQKQKVDYLHKDLIPILKDTYGIIVYQEQIMKIAQKIAGYSLAKADLLRRAVSKKERDILEAERYVFIEAALKNGYEEKISEDLYDYIVKFGDYGFNRSHSVAYAFVSYQMAYLKANYVTEFMTVMLSNVLGSEGQTSRYITDCKRYGIKILPISINKSHNNYTIENTNSIRMALQVIKGIGKNSAEHILNERNKGLFKNYIDFVFRTHSFLKQNVFEAFVFAGALDEFQLTKRAMIENYQKLLDLYRFNPSGYFTDKIELNPNLNEYSVGELMTKEKKYLGFYLSTHPIRKYLQTIQEPVIIPSQTLKYMDKSIDLVGFIESIRKTTTKNNEDMATVQISDDLTQISGVIFPKTYPKLKDKLTKDSLVWMRGRIQERNQKVQLVIFDLKVINQY